MIDVRGDRDGRVIRAAQLAVVGREANDIGSILAEGCRRRYRVWISEGDRAGAADLGPRIEKSVGRLPVVSDGALKRNCLVWTSGAIDTGINCGRLISGAVSATQVKRVR